MFCNTCSKRDTCKELCQELKDYLKSKGIYDSNWIRPRMSSLSLKKEREKGIYLSKRREIPFSSFKRKDKDGNYCFK